MEKYFPPLDFSFKDNKDLTKDINIIIVTATDTEFQAVMGQAKPIEADGKYIKAMVKSTIFYVAMYGKYKVVIIQTGQGVENTSTKLQEIQEVVNAEYVIAIGVCYGMEEGKKGTKLGSILVPKIVKIISFNTIDDDKGELNTKDRKSGDKLYAIFQSHHGFKLDDDIHYNVDVIADEDILVTQSSRIKSQEHKDLIKEIVSKALGGEMEAAAILPEGKEFEGIVIKAIADWGDKDKASCKPWRRFSAYAAAKYVWHQLSNISENTLQRKM